MNAFPPDLSLFAKQLRPPKDEPRQHQYPLLCPGSDTPIGTWETAAKWSDYIYINWSGSIVGTNFVQPWYPLAYDSRMSNHSGRGVYVIKVDGTVIWDRGAEWIKTFGREHTNFLIVLPR